MAWCAGLIAKGSANQRTHCIPTILWWISISELKCVIGCWERVYRVHWSPTLTIFPLSFLLFHNVQANGCHMAWKCLTTLLLPLWFLLLRLSLLSAFDTPTWPQMRFCLPFSVCFSPAVPFPSSFLLSPVSCLQLPFASHFLPSPRPHAPIEGPVHRITPAVCCWGAPVNDFS